MQSADLAFEDPSDVTPLDFLAAQSHSPARHSAESRQMDIRQDLMTAISATANHIMSLPAGRAQNRMLWALYCMTTLQIQVTEASRLFRVRDRAMKAAYKVVTEQLQSHLKEYAPLTPTKPMRSKRDSLPEQDIAVIRQRNDNTPPEIYRQVRELLCREQPTTLDRDLLALTGIQSGISAHEQGRRHHISKSGMQRAYERVHLLIAAQTDPTVRPRQSPKQRMLPFEMKASMIPVLQRIATELASEHDNITPLIALYGYICNLPNRALARDFDINEGTLRRYRYRVQDQVASAHSNQSA